MAPITFAVSSTAFRRLPLEEAIRICAAEGWILEFSSGLAAAEGMRSTFLQAPCKKLIHNYFPAPRDPFVLNLASLNPEVQRRTFDHAVEGLRLASEARCGFYSIHAGFCLDPDPQELGKPFALSFTHTREEHWQQFLITIEKLIPIAEQLGVGLAIENNVLARFNLTDQGGSPTLCAESGEILALCRHFHRGNSFGLLLDTAHLKVSAGTLGFDVEDLVNKLAPFVSALHHSDNDGSEDTNSPIDQTYWFLKFMPLFRDAIHTLEVHDQTVDAVKRQQHLLQKGIQ